MFRQFSISSLTVVMLVLLRLMIGWHFFSEGAKHYLDPHWTSEAVLRSAKGPLAPLYQSYLPDFHRFEELFHHDQSQNEAHAVQAWGDEIQADWDDYLHRFTQYHQLNEAQTKAATQISRHQQARLRDWITADKDALVAHVHEWRRKEQVREMPSGAVPYQRKRLAEKQSALQAESSGWQKELAGLEDDYHTALASVLDANQLEQPPLARVPSSLDLVDDTMTYVIVGVGVLLLLGLFTRAACVVGAMFLLSVVLMQPFWVGETAPTFNQYVEMFALLVLATTPSGRWAGLDFFVHHLFSAGPIPTGGARAKGNSDVSAT